MKIFKRKLSILLGGSLLVSLFACDKDFNTIGADFVGADNFNTDVFIDTEINAYNQRLTPGVQTNNLPISLIGRYTDPVYGTTDASVINQVSLSQYSPDFGDNTQIKEVVITLPYFSEVVSTDDEGANTYELDSIFGSDPVKLTIYRTNYFLRDFDPGPNGEFDEPQMYYSNQSATFDPFLSDVIYNDDTFFPSDEEVVLMETNEDTGEEEVSERLSPRLRVVYNIDDTDPNTQAMLTYFQNLILDDAAQDKLISENAFQDYFRGLHIKTEVNSGNGHAFIANLNQANIVITYTYEEADVSDEDGDGDITEVIEKEDDIRINFTENRVNTFDNMFDPTIESHIVNNDDDKLYLKGGEGSMAIIELFGPDNDGDDEADQLTQLKANNWLINEANLIFYVDRATVQGGNSEPRRLYLYDLERRAPLVDFFFNTSGATAEVAENHLGILERDEFGKGIKYKMKITEHIKNVINKDSTNRKLALVVSSAVDDFSLSAIDNPTNSEVEEIPSASVYSPKGTVLFNHNSANEEKKLKLQIYYTEQDN